MTSTPHLLTRPVWCCPTRLNPITCQSDSIPGPVVLNLDSDGAALELRVALPVSPVVLDGGVPDSRVGGGPGQPQLAVLAGAGGALSVEEAKERLEGTQ